MLNTEFQNAIKRGDLSEVKRIIGSHDGWLDLPLDAKGNTPISYAAQFGKTKILYYLADQLAVRIKRSNPGKNVGG